MPLDLSTLQTRLRALATTQPAKVPGRFRLRIGAALDLYLAPGTLRPWQISDTADCTVEVSEENLLLIAADPKKVGVLYLTSKLKVSSLSFGQKLGVMLGEALKGA